jgi:hypothetical protein
MAANPEFPTIEWYGPARSRTGPYPNKRYMVWHCTANATSNALGEAKFAASRTDGVGMHAAADAAGRCVQALETKYGTGHVASTTGNRYGIAVELCATMGSSAEHYRRTIDAAVPFVRLAAAKHGIPARWLTVAQMRDGVSKGHVTHNDARLAWGGTDHTDPGAGFSRQYVIDRLTAGVPTPTGDDVSKFIIAQGNDGQLYRCDLQTSVPFPADRIGSVVQLIAQIGGDLAVGRDDQEWTKIGTTWIRKGWSEAIFGVVAQGPGTVTLTDAQVDRIAERAGIDRATLVAAAFEGAQQAERE